MCLICRESLSATVMRPEIWSKFMPVDIGLPKLDRDQIFAESWKHPDPIVEDEHKRVKCAEILVLDCVPAHFLSGAYVANEIAKSAFCSICNLSIEVKPSIFF